MFRYTQLITINLKKDNVASRILNVKKKLACDHCKCCHDCMLFYDNVSMLLVEMITENFAKDSIIRIKFTKQFVRKFMEMCSKYKFKPKKFQSNKKNKRKRKRKRKRKTKFNSAAKISVCYHWTPSKNHKSIIDSNLVVPDGHKVIHRTDNGYFGKGIYMSPDYRYAQSYGDSTPQRKVFVCLALAGRQYPATYPKDRGSSLKNGYDSHISSPEPHNKEWVFFDSSQLLPCYLVTLENIKRANMIAKLIIHLLETL